MNPRRTFWRKIGYLVGIMVLLGVIFPLSAPSTRVASGSKGSPGGKLAQLRLENELAAAQLGKIDPTSAALKLATLGMPGIAANQLWEKANDYKMKKDWANFQTTLEEIKQLQPHFVGVWRFQAWNMSYNVSAEFDDYRERYRWVMKGIDYLSKGIEFNRREPILLWDRGWYTAQKIGRADEHRQFRVLFRQDEDFHGDRPLSQRDNWLVGRESFLEVVRRVDKENMRVRGQSPLIYRADPAMCLMNYSEAIESEGVFGERAAQAWKNAGEAWREYGQQDLSTTDGVIIQLGEQERHQKDADEWAAQLDALCPGVRDAIAAEKRAALSDEERAAIDAPLSERTAKQYEIAAKALMKLEVTHQEVAERARPARRDEAKALAEKIDHAQNLATAIQRQREIVNYSYWRDRATMEQDPDILLARSLCYEGDQQYRQTNLIQAREKFDAGLAQWRKVLDKYPQLVHDKSTGDDLVDMIKRYRALLESRDEPFPEDFVLQDVLDEHGRNQ